MFVPALVIFLAFLSTFAGGLVGLRFQKHLRLILGFTAGVLISVVAFDIFPEMFELTGQLQISPRVPALALVIGFLAFHILEKTLLIHHNHEEEYAHHHHPQVGMASALSLAGHSFLDGLGIGLGFQVSPTVGTAIAIAVISHDFCDGLNTVTLMLAHRNDRRRSFMFLILDALAPVLGILGSAFIHLSPSFVVLYLGFFAGFLLYIGASDILPEAHSDKSSFSTILMTILGAAFIYLITSLS